MKKLSKKSLALALGLSLASGGVLADSLESAYQDTLRELEEDKKLKKINQSKAINEAQKDNVEVQIELYQAVQQLKDLQNPKKDESTDEEKNKVTIDNFLKFEESYNADQFEEDSYELETGGQDYGVDYEEIEQQVKESYRFDRSMAPHQEAYISGMGKSPESYGGMSITNGINPQMRNLQQNPNGFSPDQLDAKVLLNNILSSEEMNKKIEQAVSQGVARAIKMNEASNQEGDNSNQEGNSNEGDLYDGDGTYPEENNGAQTNQLNEPSISVKEVNPDDLSPEEYLDSFDVFMLNYVKIRGLESADIIAIQKLSEREFVETRVTAGDDFVIDKKVSGVLNKITPNYIKVTLLYDDGENKLEKEVKGGLHISN